MKLVIILMLIVVIILSGCMSYDVNFKNAEGKTYFCKGHGWGLIGTAVASSNKNDCIARAEAKGYKQEEKQ